MSGITTGAAVGTVIPELGTVFGAAAGGVFDAIKGIFPSVKGPTQHLSYDQALPTAQAFEVQMLAKWSKDYAPGTGLFTEAQLAPMIATNKVNFTDMVRQFWGLSASLNQQLYNDFINVETNPIASPKVPHMYLAAQFVWYALWVLTNIDKNAGQDTNVAFMVNLFNAIFVRSVYDTHQQNLLPAAGAGGVLTVNPTNAVGGAQPTPTQAGLLGGGTTMTVLVAIGAIAAIGYNMMGKHKKAA